MKEARDSPFAPVRKVDHVSSAQRCYKSCLRLKSKRNIEGEKIGHKFWCIKELVQKKSATSNHHHILQLIARTDRKKRRRVAFPLSKMTINILRKCCIVYIVPTT